jgi:hypothetical protein
MELVWYFLRNHPALVVGVVGYAWTLFLTPADKLKWWVAYLLPAAIAFAVWGLTSPTAIGLFVSTFTFIDWKLTGLVVGGVVVVAVPLSILYRRSNYRERRDPQFKERCNNVRRWVRLACATPDKFTAAAMDQEALLEGHKYLSDEAEIDRAYADPEDPLHDRDACDQFAEFAHRHLKGLKEVKTYSAKQIGAWLYEGHEYRFNVLQMAKKLHRGEALKSLLEKEVAEERRSQRQAADARANLEEKERRRYKTPLEKTLLAFDAIVSDLKTAEETILSWDVSEVKREELLEVFKRLAAEHEFRTKRRAGLLD